jgi:hypothetical protein
LLDGTRVVQLRGVNVSGTEFACIQGGTATRRGWSIDGDQPLDTARTYAAMRSWQVQVVRVPLNEDCWLGVNGVDPRFGGPPYVAAIRKEVALIEAAGMHAILDLHWTAPGSWAAIAQQPLPDADHSPQFWSSVARTFRADHELAFDVYNEPFVYGPYVADAGSRPWDCWLHGCAMAQLITARQTGPDGAKTGYTTQVRWQSAGMQSLVDAIRGAGATQPIVVNGLDWANDDSGWLAHAPADPLDQLIVGAHEYPGQGCGEPTCWSRVFGALGARHPVLIGETGDHARRAPSPFFGRFLAYADAHGWSYLAWTWNPWSNPDNVLISDWGGTPTVGEGQAYRAHLQSTG